MGVAKETKRENVNDTQKIIDQELKQLKKFTSKEKVSVRQKMLKKLCPNESAAQKHKTPLNIG